MLFVTGCNNVSKEKISPEDVVLNEAKKITTNHFHLIKWQPSEQFF